MGEKTYKLEYFDVKARGEPLRYMFKMAGQPFEDKRVTFEEWDNGGKERAPMQHLPVLTVTEGGEDTVLFESQAIGRYLAQEFGLYGKTRQESTQIDCTVCAVNECFGHFVPNILIFHQDPDQLETEKERFHRLYLKLLNRYLDRQLQKSKSGWLVGDTVTFADVVAYSFYKDVVQRGISKQFVDEAPQSLQDFFVKFRALPAIEAWHAETKDVVSYDLLRKTRGAQLAHHYVDK